MGTQLAIGLLFFLGQFAGSYPRSDGQLSIFMGNERMARIGALLAHKFVRDANHKPEKLAKPELVIKSWKHSETDYNLLQLIASFSGYKFNADDDDHDQQQGGDNAKTVNVFVGNMCAIIQGTGITADGADVIKFKEIFPVMEKMKKVRAVLDSNNNNNNNLGKANAEENFDDPATFLASVLSNFQAVKDILLPPQPPAANQSHASLFAKSIISGSLFGQTKNVEKKAVDFLKALAADFVKVKKLLSALGDIPAISSSLDLDKEVPVSVTGDTNWGLVYVSDAKLDPDQLLNGGDAEKYRPSLERMGKIADFLLHALLVDQVLKSPENLESVVRNWAKKEGDEVLSQGTVRIFDQLAVQSGYANFLVKKKKKTDKETQKYKAQLRRKAFHVMVGMYLLVWNGFLNNSYKLKYYEKTYDNLKKVKAHFKLDEKLEKPEAAMQAKMEEEANRQKEHEASTIQCTTAWGWMFANDGFIQRALPGGMSKWKPPAIGYVSAKGGVQFKRVQPSLPQAVGGSNAAQSFDELHL